MKGANAGAVLPGYVFQNKGAVLTVDTFVESEAAYSLRQNSEQLFEHFIYFLFTYCTWDQTSTCSSLAAYSLK